MSVFLTSPSRFNLKKKMSTGLNHEEIRRIVVGRLAILHLSTSHRVDAGRIPLIDLDSHARIITILVKIIEEVMQTFY